MYFHPRQGTQGQFVAKTDLANDHHLPNGRKVYLHHPENHINARLWESSSPNDRADQKVCCTPLNDDQNFYFHIDFDNLSKAELTLLLTSLRPSPEFRHRLGLGKPLGLGTVEVAIEGVFLIDRIARYGLDALNQPRYHTVCRKGPPQEIAWTERYPEEAARVRELQDEGKFTWPEPDTTLIDDETLKILQTVGDPGNLEERSPVQPPLLDGQDPEHETFRWFQENERSVAPQALKPILANKKLPTLNT
jgi:hypothetical protein